MKEDFLINMAVKHVLQTPDQEKKVQYELNWFKRAKSTDQKIASEAFRERWSEIEASVNDETKAKLKHKFNIE